MALRRVFLLEGQQLRYAGNGIGYEDVIIKGDPDELKVGSPTCACYNQYIIFEQFVAYYTKGEKVLAVARYDSIVA